MFCMKCGKEIEDTQVFCPECLAVMERFPVKPGTAIQLPTRQEQPAARKVIVRKKELSPEKRIRRLKGVIACLCSAVTVLALALGICLFLLFGSPDTEIPTETKGKNYSTIAPGEENTLT